MAGLLTPGQPFSSRRWAGLGLNAAPEAPGVIIRSSLHSSDRSLSVPPPLGGSVLNSSVAGNVVTVNLQGITNAQTVTVNLLGMTGAVTGDLSVPMGVLVGDTTADSSVNSADIGQTKSKSGQVVDGTNFRNDVTVDGSLNSADIGLVKSKSGTSLLAPLRRR